MSQQVIMALAQTDAEDTLQRPVISIHGSIAEAQEHFLTHHLPAIHGQLLENEEPITQLDDPRVVMQVNLTGTTSIDVDFEQVQMSATIKVVL